MTEVQGTLRVHTGRKGALTGDLFGIFFEDLNHAADGGLYAELVQNRSFEFDPIDRKDYHALTAWEKVERGGGSAIVKVEDTDPLHLRNKHYASIEVVSEGAGVGLMNLGFNSGISVREGESYLFSMYARRDMDSEVPVAISIEDTEGTIYAETRIPVHATKWTKYEARLTTQGTSHNARLVILTQGQGKLYLDMVSLFPENTFKQRSNGLRKDIAGMLADMKPKFMRFPGGCLVHDGSLNSEDRDSMYRWKNTIGDLVQRPARRNNWQYNQTLGLGYYEYFQFCEDIGAKPIPVLPGGYDPHHHRMVPIEELGPWIDDALDVIEFACGDVSSVWGAIRAELGHPEPFGLDYIAIGNEEVGEPFFERYAYFHRAIKEKYPKMKIINSSGPFAAGGEYERGWKSAREHGSDLVDEHYYQSPEWFLANYHRYDDFKADDPKVFLGEYASIGNTYYNALVEAAFMTGLEKNTHAVGLACYAPALCNIDYVNWKTDMIWFNNHEVFGTPNYYVQKLFMVHQGDQVLHTEASCFPLPEELVDRLIEGNITFKANRSSILITDMRLLNNETGEIKILPNVEGEIADPAFNADLPSELDLGLPQTSNFTLTCNVTRTGGDRGLILNFGLIDDHNHFSWEIGGWQNQDSLIGSKIAGRNSVLTQSMFAVESNKPYSLKLEVVGRKIRTWIDGDLINETEDKLPQIEPLYYSSTVELATGDIILKVVNVSDQSTNVEVELDEFPINAVAGEIVEMSGYLLSDENSFEEPLKVSPKLRTFEGWESHFPYEFPKQSITIFRFKTNDCHVPKPSCYPSPFILNRADPYIMKHTDGYYYFTGSVPEFDRIVLRRAKRIVDLPTAEETVIWYKHETGEMGEHIWAPELHYIDGAWYIYFAAGAAEDKWAIRQYVLACNEENPLTGTWLEKGKIAMNFESFTLDATTFEHDGKRYLVWAQYEAENSNLYIAEMSNPWTITGQQVMLSSPTYDWERQLYNVNEGPAVLKRNGKIFLYYSASATDERYCMGLLTANDTSNLLDPTSWEKSAEPVFVTNDEAGEYGPGHNSFTVSEDGLDDILVYHSRPYKGLQGSALSDPNRHARVQKLFWHEDGTPDLKVPGYAQITK